MEHIINFKSKLDDVINIEDRGEQPNKVHIRASTLGDFLSCRQKWYQRHVLKRQEGGSAAASTGTAIHKGIENYWQDCMVSGAKSTESIGKYSDSAVESFRMLNFEAEERNQPIDYSGKDEDENACERKIVAGMGVFFSDILPFVKIPKWWRNLLV